MMFLKIHHPTDETQGRIVTSKTDRQFSWEPTADLVIEVGSPAEIESVFSTYPGYLVSHRAKKGDARELGTGRIFSSLAS